MSLAFKLDRIAARADELRAMLSEGISGEAYVKASKELSDIEPVVARSAICARPNGRGRRRSCCWPIRR